MFVHVEMKNLISRSLYFYAVGGGLMALSPVGMSITQCKALLTDELHFMA